MIRAKATISGFDTLVLGLSHQNLDRLRGGEPIQFAGEPFGLSCNILIFAGENEEAMRVELTGQEPGDLSGRDEE